MSILTDGSQAHQYLDPEGERLLGQLERSLAWMRRNKSAENVALVVEIEQIVAEIRAIIEAPKR